MAKIINVHGTALVIDGFGVMLRGASGSGKSLLALELIAQAQNNNRQIKLLADDRINIIIKDNQIFMQTPPALAGKIELYGHGIISRPYIKSAKLNLIVDFVENIERMPEQKQFIASFENIEIARCPIPIRNQTDINHQILLIDEAIFCLKK